MSRFVVDASAGVKWFVPEVHSDAAQRLQAPNHDLHVPAFFDVEVANVVWKKLRRGELTRAEGDAILAQLVQLPLTRHADTSLLAGAFDLADKTLRTVYDCMYLTLALSIGGKMVTADERLLASLAGTPWVTSIQLVQDVP